MRCPRCGNENPGTNRYCGMCGATLLSPASVAPPPEPGPAPTTPAASSSAAQTAPPRPASEPTPAISGPSFLGLNDPPPSKPSKRGSLSIDPNTAPSSRSLEYLLEDDEPKRGGAGKFVVIVVALILVVCLGYLRWKNQDFGWLGKSAPKPSAAQNADTPDGNASASTPAQPTTNPSISPVPSTPTASAPASKALGTSPATNPAPTNPPANPAPASAPPASNSGDSNPSSSPAPAQPDAAHKDSSDAAADATPAESAKPKSEPPPKPSAAPKPVKAADPVADAQKYIYGKGARQDCDRGLRLLKPAAEQSNPKAMVEMGALYSAGLCTPRDLPTAYRWFALALRKDPDNQSVQADLQKLWGEMTQPERQLAIRLSQ